MKSRAFCVVFLAAVLSAGTGVCAETEFENLTERVGRGFGSTWNRYAWAMGELDGKTYVGTWSTQFDYPQLVSMLLDGSLLPVLGDLLAGGNPLESIGMLASDGAEIWRHDGGKSWTRVYKAGRETSGFRKAVTHNNTLYIGALNASQGTRIVFTGDGVSWADLTGGPIDNPDNISVRTMLSHAGRLYVGTENNATGGQLWAYDDGTKTWQLVETFPDDSSVAELAVWDGRIALGTWDFTDSYNFYIQQPDGQWKKATPVIPGGQALSNLGVMKLIRFKGYLYLGTVNYRDGFTLLRSSDPDRADSWGVITTDGLGNPDNGYAWAMVEWDGKLMLGTFNRGPQTLSLLIPPPYGTAELYSSEDGVNWEFIPGDYANIYNYGIRNMIVTPSGDLLLGMASNFLVPDCGSGLYPCATGNPLVGDVTQLAMQACMGILTGQDPTKPWIGCEVYRAVKPAKPALGTFPARLLPPRLGPPYPPW